MGPSGSIPYEHGWGDAIPQEPLFMSLLIRTGKKCGWGSTSATEMRGWRPSVEFFPVRSSALLSLVPGQSSFHLSLPNSRVLPATQ